MTTRSVLIAPLALLAGASALAGDAQQSTQAALLAESDDHLVATAALLIAAEEAADAEMRAPAIKRLEALAVGVHEGESDDPLGAWREEYHANGGVPYRGRALGPAYRRAQIAPGKALVIDQIFYAGKRAEMAAQARGGEPVALAIANPREDMVCEAQLQPGARCRWLPIFTERFTIRLENKGKTPASVYLVFE